MWKTIITRNTGTQETRGDEDYKLKPKQNHCYGHTPQIQKGAKTSNSGVKRMPFVTVISVRDTEKFAKHLISNACILLSMSAVMVHVSHAYKNMDMARECISLILELMAMFLLFQMTFSLVTAAVVWAILESTSGLDPSSDTIALRYLSYGRSPVSCCLW